MLARRCTSRQFIQSLPQNRSCAFHHTLRRKTRMISPVLVIRRQMPAGSTPAICSTFLWCPSPQEHASTIRMHPADHGGAGEGGDRLHSRLCKSVAHGKSRRHPAGRLIRRIVREHHEPSIEEVMQLFRDAAVDTRRSLRMSWPMRSDENRPSLKSHAAPC